MAPITEKERVVYSDPTLDTFDAVETTTSRGIASTLVTALIVLATIALVLYLLQRVEVINLGSWFDGLFIVDTNANSR